MKIHAISFCTADSMMKLLAIRVVGSGQARRDGAIKS